MHFKCTQTKKINQIIDRVHFSLLLQGNPGSRGQAGTPGAPGPRGRTGAKGESGAGGAKGDRVSYKYCNCTKAGVLISELYRSGH